MTELVIDADIWGLNEDPKLTNDIGYFGNDKRYEFNNKAYGVWYHILKLVKENPCEYEICEEWKDYNNFYEWYEANYYSVDGEKMDLLKDIFDPYNKEYCPKMCIFVPYRITRLLKGSVSKTDLPVGVGRRKDTDMYYSTCAVIKNGKKTTIRHSGFKTPAEAYKQYLKDRKQYISDVAEAYRYDIPEKLYYALLDWEIDSQWKKAI